MVTIPTTAFLICLHLAAGSFLLLPIPPIREFGLGFFRTMAMIATLIMGAAVYLMPLHVATAAAPEFSRFDTLALSVSYGLGSAAIYVLLFLLMLGYTVAMGLGRLALGAVLLIATVLGSLVAIGASAAPFVAALPDGWSRLLVPVNFYVSAVYQASGLVAMILGHQYLMPVRLPFRAFEIFARIFFVSCLAQCALVGVNLLRELSGPHAPLLGAMLTLEHPLALFLWIRLGVGLLLVALVAAMTVHCVKLRANMAATGLLYVGMSMAIGGEIFARILLMTTSILF